MCVCLGEFIQTHWARPWKRMWGIQQFGGSMWVGSRSLGVGEGGLFWKSRGCSFGNGVFSVGQVTGSGTLS